MFPPWLDPQHASLSTFFSSLGSLEALLTGIHYISEWISRSSFPAQVYSSSWYFDTSYAGYLRSLSLFRNEIIHTLTTFFEGLMSIFRTLFTSSTILSGSVVVLLYTISLLPFSTDFSLCYCPSTSFLMNSEILHFCLSVGSAQPWVSGAWNSSIPHDEWTFSRFWWNRRGRRLYRYLPVLYLAFLNW